MKTARKDSATVLLLCIIRKLAPDMSVVDDVRVAIQDFLTPEMRELKARIDALEQQTNRFEERTERRFEHLESKIDSRFDRLDRCFAR
jgi:hypothetical protein